MLTADDVMTWLADLPQNPPLDDDRPPDADTPGERISVDLASAGTLYGGEGWSRKPNFTVTIAAAPDRVQLLQDAVEARLLHFPTFPKWPTADGHRVLYVDYQTTGNGWQRRPIDPDDRHVRTAAFYAEQIVPAAL